MLKQTLSDSSHYGAEAHIGVFSLDTDNDRCTNCHEELYILDQYYDLGMDLPNEDTRFMQRVKKLEQEINGCNCHNRRN